VTSPIPVSLVSGFLGSGKTTLINHILRSDHGLRIMVMVNDFGEINIDSELIISAAQNVLSLANGCICCTLENDLIEQLEQLLSSPSLAFDYILIETSGISDPARVLATLRYPRFARRLRVDNVVTMLDAEQFPRLEGSMLELARAQLTDAKLVVINKTDLVSEAGVEQLRSEWLCPDTRSYATIMARVPLQLLFDPSPDIALVAPGQRKPQGLHSEFVHWSWQSPQPFALQKLRRVLAQLPTSVYRAKGVLYIAELAGQPVALNMVGHRSDMEKLDSWAGAQPCSRLVMIAGSATTDFDTIEHALQDAIAVSN